MNLGVSSWELLSNFKYTSEDKVRSKNDIVINNNDLSNYIWREINLVDFIGNCRKKIKILIKIYVARNERYGKKIDEKSWFISKSGFISIITIQTK